MVQAVRIHETGGPEVMVLEEQVLAAPAIVVSSNGRNTPSGVSGNTIKAYLEKP